MLAICSLTRALIGRLNVKPASNNIDDFSSKSILEQDSFQDYKKAVFLSQKTILKKHAQRQQSRRGRARRCHLRYDFSKSIIIKRVCLDV